MRDDSRVLMNSRRWLMGVAVLASLTLVPVAQGAGSSDNGTWTRSVRAGGETWIYRFTVPGVPAPGASGAVASGLYGGGGEVPRAGRQVSERTLDRPGPVGDNQAADTTVDLEALRAYLATQPSGNAAEVTTPAVGQPVYFHLDYRLVGPVRFVEVNRRAVIDGLTFCTGTNSVIPGNFSTWCTDGWVATAGSHTLRWDLDYDDTVAEVNEDNNSTSATWTTPQATQVDLEAKRAYLKTATGAEGSEVTTPVVGQTVYFHVDYRLVGPVRFVEVNRRAVIDGLTFCTDKNSVIPGDFSTWCLDGWVATAGSHTLRWDLDYNDAVAEANENNNSTSAMWTSPQAGQVDLEAKRVYLQTAAGGEGSEVTAPAVGQTVYFYVAFRIVGPGDAVVSDRRAVLDGETFCSFADSTTPGDYYAWCTDGWTATEGTHTLRWDLDFDNSVAESNENNNSATETWTSAATESVDLEAQRAFLNTMEAGAGDDVTTPAVGQAVYFHLDYRLIGPNAVTVDRRAVLDGEPFCSFTGMPPPGEYLTWCIDAWTATAGSHILQWDLDYNNTVAETDESNNYASTMWRSGSTTCSGDCDGNGAVTVDELLTMVNDALNDALACAAGDTNGDGEIAVDEILAGVNRALNGCG